MVFSLRAVGSILGIVRPNPSPAEPTGSRVSAPVALQRQMILDYLTDLRPSKILIFPVIQKQDHVVIPISVRKSVPSFLVETRANTTLPPSHFISLWRQTGTLHRVEIEPNHRMPAELVSYHEKYANTYRLAATKDKQNVCVTLSPLASGDRALTSDDKPIADEIFSWAEKIYQEANVLTT